MTARRVDYLVVTQVGAKLDRAGQKGRAGVLCWAGLRTPRAASVCGILQCQQGRFVGYSIWVGRWELEPASLLRVSMSRRGRYYCKHARRHCRYPQPNPGTPQRAAMVVARRLYFQGLGPGAGTATRETGLAGSRLDWERPSEAQCPASVCGVSSCGSGCFCRAGKMRNSEMDLEEQGGTSNSVTGTSGAFFRWGARNPGNGTWKSNNAEGPGLES